MNNNSRHHWDRKVFGIESAAAASFIATGPAKGEIWRVVAASVNHDDPAANAGTWYITTAGGATISIGNGVSMATGVKASLYADTLSRDSLILGYGDTIRLAGSALAAGKKWYMYLCIELLRGAV